MRNAVRGCKPPLQETVEKLASRKFDSANRGRSASSRVPSEPDFDLKPSSMSAPGAPRVWGQLPDHLRKTTSLTSMSTSGALTLGDDSPRRGDLTATYLSTGWSTAANARSGMALEVYAAASSSPPESSRGASMAERVSQRRLQRAMDRRRTLDLRAGAVQRYWSHEQTRLAVASSAGHDMAAEEELARTMLRRASRERMRLHLSTAAILSSSADGLLSVAAKSATKTADERLHTFASEDLRRRKKSVAAAFPGGAAHIHPQTSPLLRGCLQFQADVLRPSASDLLRSPALSCDLRPSASSEIIIPSEEPKRLTKAERSPMPIEPLPILKAPPGPVVAPSPGGLGGPPDPIVPQTPPTPPMQRPPVPEPLHEPEALVADKREGEPAKEPRKEPAPGDVGPSASIISDWLTAPSAATARGESEVTKVSPNTSPEVAEVNVPAAPAAAVNVLAALPAAVNVLAAPVVIAPPAPPPSAPPLAAITPAAPEPAPAGWLSGAVQIVEGALGIDLDGDGLIALAPARAKAVVAPDFDADEPFE